MMVEPRHLDQLLHPMFENEKAYKNQVVATGLAASPGERALLLLALASSR
jgi:pyruvate,orthophosphate dikinase